MILIIGGNGFVGQHLAANLARKNQRVTIAGRSSARLPDMLAQLADANIAVDKVDVTSPFDVMGLFHRHRPEIVIDLSGHAPKKLSLGADVQFRVNSLTNILEAARIHVTGKIVLMSSMDTYWGLDNDLAPYREDMPVPLIENDDHFIVQAWAKKTLEVIANLYIREAGSPIRIARAAGVYGPLYRTLMNVPSRLAHAAVGRLDLTATVLPAAEDGYDQIFVEDMVEGLAMLALADDLRHRVYNLGSGEAYTYQRFAQAAMAARPGFAISLPSRAEGGGALIGPDQMAGRCIDISRARTELGFQPRFTPETAMAKYIAWLEETPL
ncbi:NAD-dependent epimerase/dehydratase family protein [Novosphingobium sp. Leaf2]|uniref:NAD-dependent epimerase/dehydratase family protein n=1 Tax=Novosphingobium sp. Leaf2 TaxID=1735670 RepID=UPI0006FC080B|nr:NAD(P)-dependent oxidoreductase [Novosphingobium sp. Leaf2]KQM14671.1 hypothetical protein ASE49_10860 [Novosphingobium sp. Leaf2]